MDRSFYRAKAIANRELNEREVDRRIDVAASVFLSIYLFPSQMTDLRVADRLTTWRKIGYLNDAG